MSRYVVWFDWSDYLSNADLREPDLSGVDLTNADLRVSNLTNADLSLTALNGSVFNCKSRKSADLTGNTNQI